MLGASILTIGVLVLFGWAVAMALFTVWLRTWARRRQSVWRAAEDDWRPVVQAFVLEQTPLPSPRGLDRRVVLDLLLRYSALVRGAEADHIVAYLEREGYVSDALRDLRSRDHWRRARAAVMLGRMGSRRAVSALIRALHDPSPEVRAMAAHSLAAIGDPRAVAGLAAALTDSSGWTSSTLAADLIGMGAEVVPVLVEIVRRGERRDSDAPEAAITAVRVLGEIRDPRATPALLDLLRRSEDLDLRARAASALGNIGGPEAARALVEALTDPAWQVRAQAATGLGALGDTQTVAALERTIHDESWWVRRNCAEALGRLGAPGRRALRRLADSRDRYVRDRATAVLETLGHARASTGERELVMSP